MLAEPESPSAPALTPDASRAVGGQGRDEAATMGTGRGSSRPGRVLPAIVVLGLLLTALGTWAAVRADGNTEDRLLAGQTRQASTVLSTAILLVKQPLAEALFAQQLVSPDRRAAVFGTEMGPQVGRDLPFAAASLWRQRGSTFREIRSVGGASGVREGRAGTNAFLGRAAAGKDFVVRRVSVNGLPRIGYALADAGTGFVVYAERPIPADRRARVDRDSAFADLDYAIYLGTTDSTSSMLTTNVDPASLPMTGRTSQATVPFGDTRLVLVASPHGHLGSPLSHRLPWIILVIGLLLTLAAWAVARQLVRARQRAEQDTRTITGLYQRVDTLFGEQRASAERLQRSLLPQATPDIPGIEIAAEYVAGAQGVDIGGDWYSVIPVGEHHFAFVVGDVSGNGIDAVSEMARARFTLRAYLLDGCDPGTALEKSSRQFDVTSDGHIVTVLAGVGHRGTGEIVLASAGHPPPLLVAGDDAEFLTVPTGPPLGTGSCAYASTSLVMPAGSTLFSYTDGLVERRDQDLADGMTRLAATVRRAPGEPLRTLVSEVLESMHEGDVSDDIAVLALRRRSE
jgi:serine phosphatase RsbU (regulator of sigma subunit)